MLSFGIIGCGKIFAKHQAAIKRLTQEGLGQIVAISEACEERLNHLVETYHVKGYTDYRAMLEKEQLDIVLIATPSGSHAEIGLEVAKRDSNIIMEKPLTLTLEDADHLIEACGKRHIRLFEIKQNRFNCAIQKVKEAISMGRLGKITSASANVLWHRDQAYYDSADWRGTWAMDGGVFANQAIHHIDLLLWLLGPVESVMAKGEASLLDIETEDTGIALFKFTKGTLATLHATVCVRPRDLEGSINIFGEKGTIQIGGFSADKIKTWDMVDPRPEDLEMNQQKLSNPDDFFAYAHYQCLKDITQGILEKRPAVIDGYEARKTLELLNAMYESMETKQEVFLVFKPQHSKLGS